MSITYVLIQTCFNYLTFFFISSQKIDQVIRYQTLDVYCIALYGTRTGIALCRIWVFGLLCQPHFGMNDIKPRYDAVVMLVRLLRAPHMLLQTSYCLLRPSPKLPGLGLTISIPENDSNIPETLHNLSLLDSKQLYDLNTCGCQSFYLMCD